MKDYLEKALEIYEDVTEWRRHIHQNPELSFQEYETSDYVEKLLRSFGYEPRRVGGTGLVAELAGTRGKGPTIALRADMDALPGEERTHLPYASRKPNVMHSCGHDVHTAILLGVAALLPKLKDRFFGNVKFFFQPAEEGLGGAKTFVEAGELNGVSGVAALHVMSDYEVGSIALKRGVALAATDRLSIRVKGCDAHGAQPHRGVDAVVLASHIVVALQSLVSRTISPLDSAVVTIGKMHGGLAPNIIAPEMILEGTLRTLSRQTRSVLLARMEDIICGIAKNMGGEASLEVIDGTPPRAFSSNSFQPLDDSRENVQSQSFG